ncbi:hypothetical protein HAX54_027470 [Datura stramonium]|uniref:Uncharacterized protein n=1 Tax=Datura stramonium TaxID=4076 RepID=A0ABS8V4Z9_DATST|nr:hypothetical protein [Datura stramonium]
MGRLDFKSCKGRHQGFWWEPKRTIWGKTFNLSGSVLIWWIEYCRTSQHGPTGWDHPFLDFFTSRLLFFLNLLGRCTLQQTDPITPIIWGLLFTMGDFEATTRRFKSRPMLLYLELLYYVGEVNLEGFYIKSSHFCDFPLLSKGETIGFHPLKGKAELCYLLLLSASPERRDNKLPSPQGKSRAVLSSTPSLGQTHGVCPPLLEPFL